LFFAGLVIIATMFLVAILGYAISPDSSPFANEQILSIAAKPPMFEVNMLTIPKNRPDAKSSFLHTMLFGKESNFTFIPVDSIRLAGDSLIINEYSNDGKDGLLQSKIHVVSVLYAVDNKTPIIEDQNGFYHFRDHTGERGIISSSLVRLHINGRLLKRKTFILGTDRFGRDMLSRLIIGTRVSFSVGFISVFISLLIGIPLGIIAGYYRGIVDSIVSWFVNVVWSIPTLLMVLSITLVLGKGFWQVFLAVGLTMWVEVTRVVRGQVIGLREKEFIEAAKALGFGDLRILFKHILPNTVGPIVIITAGNFASAILMEAGLSFLGIGIQPPVPSWGNMIKDHYAYIILDKPYLAILPGMAIMLLVLAFNFIGSGLRDAFDTRIT
jgi:peptide/nickel transport system permease protein